MEITEAWRLLLALAIGAVIGLERERNTAQLVDVNKDPYAPAGLRTYTLVALLGGLAGLVAGTQLLLAIVISVLFGTLTMAYYVFHTHYSKDMGITSEIASVLTFVFGFLIATQAIPMTLTIAAAVVLLVLLSRKETIKDLIGNVHRSEINAFASFAIISLVILPFLPDTSITFGDLPALSQFLGTIGLDLGMLQDVEVINPRKLWTIVALITGLDLLGHFLQRTIGQRKGWLFTSIAGGFISSTATTLSIAQQTKKMKTVNPMVASAVFSNMASFFQIAILIGAINATMLANSLPVLIAMILSSLGAGLFFYFKKEKGATDELSTVRKSIKESEIINIVPALKFAGIFLVIRLVSKIALVFLGSAGFLLATALGALSGLDAVLINAAELAGNAISYELAVWSLILANAINLTSKSVYSYMQGSREFAMKFGIAMMIIVVASFIGVFFI